MDDQKDPLLSRQDDLHAENNVLKVKLALEHGMQMENTSTLSPGVENQFLKSVYAFEQQYKDAKRVSVYDYLGSPAFSKADTLTPEQTSEELSRLRSIMADRNIELDCICEYDDAIVYRFLTEELFAHEMDDMCIPGMITHFIYEEFHPNHDYDLRRQTGEFMDLVFSRPWNADFHEIILSRQVTFCANVYDCMSISSIIQTFQEAHTSLNIDRMDIAEVVIDPGLTQAHVSGTLSVSGNMKQGEKIRYEGIFSFHFIREDEYWNIDAFNLPGLSKKEMGG